MRVELNYSSDHTENAFSDKVTLKEALREQKALLEMHIKSRIISEATFKKIQKQIKEKYEKSRV